MLIAPLKQLIRIRSKQDADAAAAAEAEAKAIARERGVPLSSVSVQPEQNKDPFVSVANFKIMFGGMQKVCGVVRSESEIEIC